MAEPDERARFNGVRQEIRSCIESMRKASHEAAEYLEKYPVMEEDAMTFEYTGDERITLLPMPDAIVGPSIQPKR